MKEGVSNLVGPRDSAKAGAVVGLPHVKIGGTSPQARNILEHLTRGT